MQNCRAGNFLNSVETESSRVAYLEHNHPQFLYNTDHQQHAPFATDSPKNPSKPLSRPYSLFFYHFFIRSTANSKNDQITGALFF